MGPAALLVLAGALAAAGSLQVTSGTAPLEVAGERYLVLEDDRVVRAVVSGPERGDRLIVDLVRLGPSGSRAAGEAPVLVSVAGTKNVLPNRGPLVEDVPVEGAGDVASSRPVRYYLDLPRRKDVDVEVSLRKRDGGRAAVRLTVLSRSDPGALPTSSLDRALRKARRASGGRAPAAAPSTTAGPATDPTTAAAPTTAAPTTAAEGPPLSTAAAGAAAPEPPSSSPDRLLAQAQPGEAATSGRAAVAAPPLPEVNGRLVVLVRDGMGDLFRLREMRVFVDGQPVLVETARGEDGLPRTLVAFDQAVPIGAHEVSVRLVYEGNAGGLFSYMQGYVFHVGDTRAAHALPDQVTRVTFVAKEQGGLFTEIEDRPTIQADVRTEPR